MQAHMASSARDYVTVQLITILNKFENQVSCHLQVNERWSVLLCEKTQYSFIFSPIKMLTVIKKRIVENGHTTILRLHNLYSRMIACSRTKLFCHLTSLCVSSFSMLVKYISRRWSQYYKDDFTICSGHSLNMSEILPKNEVNSVSKVIFTRRPVFSYYSLIFSIICL